jgi:lysophospholipase L1-like esterase
MRKKRLPAAGFAALALAGLAAACPMTAQAAKASAYPHDGSLADRDILYVGRWDRSVPTAYHSYWGGAYLRATFTGTTIGFRGGATAGGPSVLVSVDGEAPHKVNALNARPLMAGVHTLTLGSPGQNSEFEFKGLALSPGARTLPTPARPLVEFVGDSITTGGGQTLPATVNYAWMSTEMLGADHTQIAFSARALTTGYGCAGDKAGLDTQYFQLKNFNHLGDTPPTPWDFSYTPQVIVINLGQNDQCGSEPDAIFTASYVGFVHNLRARFPRVQLVALRPFGGPYEAAIRRAVESLSTAGDARLHYIDTTGWLEKADFVDGVHPTQPGHMKVALRLAPLLRPLLGKE